MYFSVRVMHAGDTERFNFDFRPGKVKLLHKKKLGLEMLQPLQSYTFFLYWISNILLKI